MSRRTISMLFYGSLIAMAVGLVMLGVALAVAFASDSFVMDGNSVVGIQTTLGWSMATIGAIALLILVAAAIGQLVAWIGALIATASDENKTWFLVLLVAGLLGFSFIAMLVFLLVEASQRNVSGGQRPTGDRPAMA
jgi:hypothetical protein